MTNEAAQLSPRQRRPLSPLTTSHSDSRKGANRAVCYTPKYLLQMETALARFAWQGKTKTQPRGRLANTGLPHWQARKYFRKTRRGLTTQSEAKSFRGLSSLPGVLALLCNWHFVPSPWGKMCLRASWDAYLDLKLWGQYFKQLGIRRAVQLAGHGSCFFLCLLG